MEIERITIEPQRVVGVHKTIPMTELPDFFDHAFQSSFTAMTRAGVVPVGPPLAVYQGEVGESVDVTAGFPIAGEIAPAEGITVVDLPAGPGVSCIHSGSYDSLEDTYKTLMEWLKQQHLAPAETMWEQYLVGPDTATNPDQWRTKIVYPVTI